MKDILLCGYWCSNSKDTIIKVHESWWHKGKSCARVNHGKGDWPAAYSLYLLSRSWIADFWLGLSSERLSNSTAVNPTLVAPTKGWRYVLNIMLAQSLLDQSYAGEPRPIWIDSTKSEPKWFSFAEFKTNSLRFGRTASSPVQIGISNEDQGANYFATSGLK